MNAKTSKTVAISPLEQLTIFLCPTPEDTKSIPFDELRAELRAEGIDPEALLARIVKEMPERDDNTETMATIGQTGRPANMERTATHECGASLDSQILPTPKVDAEAGSLAKPAFIDQSHNSTGNGITPLFGEAQALYWDVGFVAPGSFIEKQLQTDMKAKQLAANWVADRRPLSPTRGAGVVFDAGSTCCVQANTIFERVRNDKCINIQVRTNSLLIINQWNVCATSPKFTGSGLEIFGTRPNVVHGALFGPDVPSMLSSGGFYPSQVFIGTSAVLFTERPQILFGFEAGDPELLVKQTLFQIPAEERIILATPMKIGARLGRSFDILKTDNLDVRAPIYLITAAPEPNSQEQTLFNRAKRIFRGETFQNAVKERGIQFHWIIVREDASGNILEETLDAPAKEKRGRFSEGEPFENTLEERQSAENLTATEWSQRERSR